MSEARTNEFGQPIGVPVPGWAGAAPPSRVDLIGDVVRLEPVDEHHAADILEHLSELSLWTYRPDLPPASLTEATDVTRAWRDSPDWTTFAIVPESGRVEGLASLLRCDPVQGSVEVGAIIFARSLQGTRAATEAMHLLMTYVFDELGYRRYEWKCDSLNEPSRRAARRLGFAYEGQFRNAVVYKDRNRDTNWFSITAEEWPQLRVLQQQWLAEDNFDPDGAQRVSLSSLTEEWRRGSGRRSSVAQ